MTQPSNSSAIIRLGGVATWAELIAELGRAGLRRALDSASIIRVGRGRYVIGAVSEHRRRAHGLTGVLSHLSAAVHHGWKVKLVPTEAWITVPRTRHVRGSRQGVRLHWADLSAEELSAGVTSPLRTVLDCARAVNPLESVLRALALEAGLDLTPQLVVAEPGFFAVADLGDEQLRLVVEADGFEHHGTRAGLRADCARHTGYALHGWTSLRFSYEDAMYASAGSSGCSGRGSPARSPLPGTIPRPPDACRTCNDTRHGRASGVSGRQ